MSSIPYIEYTKLGKDNIHFNKWYNISHLSNACASADIHRTSAYAICLLEKGSLQLETDLFVQKAEAPAIFTIAPESIRKFTELEEEYEAHIFFFRKEIFLKRQADINYLERFNFFKGSHQEHIPLDTQQFSMFKSYFNLIAEKSSENSPHTSEIVRSLIYIILNELDSVQVHNRSKIETLPNRANAILIEFKKLLSENFIQERQVSFYAESLHLSPKYFATVIREVSGKTPSDWINEMLLLEAKVRLKNLDLSISEIAYGLNFSDPSHFGRFFKRHSNLTPLEYRNQ